MNLFNKAVKEVDTEPKEIVMYTEEQLMARLKFFIGICLALTLVGIVFVVLYSLIFVTQPMNAISPMDQKFFELIIPIATFLTGTLSGIMLAGGDKELQAKALDAANRAPTISPSPTSAPSGFKATPTFSASPTSSFGNTAPTGFGTPPTPAAGMATAPTMSTTGKPMPLQDPEPEL